MSEEHDGAVQILKTADESYGRSDVYILARICAALERLADAQETIAAGPFEGFPDDKETFDDIPRGIDPRRFGDIPIKPITHEDIVAVIEEQKKDG